MFLAAQKEPAIISLELRLGTHLLGWLLLGDEAAKQFYKTEPEQRAEVLEWMEEQWG